jgi:hypothetical protein
MPAKGEEIQANLTVLKVGDNPRTFGDNGKAWEIVVDEGSPFGPGVAAGRIEVFAEAGAQALRGLKGQTAPMTLRFTNEYQGQWNAQIIKAGSWVKGQGGGGGRGRDFPPDAVGRAVASAAAQAASQVYAGLGDGADVDQIVRLGDIFYDWIVIKGDEYAKGIGAAPAQPKAQAAQPVAPVNGDGKITTDQMGIMHAISERLGWDHNEMKRRLRPVDPESWSLTDLTEAQGVKCIDFLKAREREMQDVTA